MHVAGQGACGSVGSLLREPFSKRTSQNSVKAKFAFWGFYAVWWIEDKRAPKCPVMQGKQACCPSAGYPTLPLNLQWSSRSIAWLRRGSLVPTSTYDSPSTPLQRACSPSGCRCARSCGGAAGAFCQTRLTIQLFRGLERSGNRRRTSGV